MALWLELLRLLALAAVLRRTRSGGALRLPPVASRRVTPEEQAELVRRCNRLTHLLARASRHFCWYRCYPLAALLRKRGVPAQLNIGLMGLNQRTRGHCWLTIGGRVFNEPDGQAAAFPVFLGENGRGLAFWAAAGQGIYTSRKAPTSSAAGSSK